MVCLSWLGLKFWVELNGHKPWVVFYFHNLDQVTLWVYPRDNQPGIFHFLPVGIVELKSVTVSFRYLLFVIYQPAGSAGFESAWAGPQSHGCPFVCDRFLIVHYVDDWSISGGIKLCAVGILFAKNIAGKINYGNLHFQTIQNRESFVPLHTWMRESSLQFRDHQSLRAPRCRPDP